MEIIHPSFAPWQGACRGDANTGRPFNVPFLDESFHYQVKVQPFRAGGYELTCRMIDAQKIADMSLTPRRYGVRVDVGERSMDSLLRARQRAKQMVRYRIKDMGGNRLCTLTIRQDDLLGYWSPDDWAAAFARYRVLLRRANLLSDYVAILEPHKKGLDRLAIESSECGHARAAESMWSIPLHLHFVTRSQFKMPVDLMRKCWAIAAGRDGNIDVQYMRSKHGDDGVIDRVASYVTKYVSKDWGAFERFNKKRYWCAGESLLVKGRVWLRSRDARAAWVEVLSQFRISADQESEIFFARRAFFFADGSGFWMNVRPSSVADPPPF